MSGVHLGQQPGHPDHEELVQIGAENRQELNPFQQRIRLVRASCSTRCWKASRLISRLTYSEGSSKAGCSERLRLLRAFERLAFARRLDISMTPLSGYRAPEFPALPENCARWLPIARSPIFTLPIAVRTSLRTRLPTASIIRRTCRFLPSVIVFSRNVEVAVSRSRFTSWPGRSISLVRHPSATADRLIRHSDDVFTSKSSELLLRIGNAIGEIVVVRQQQETARVLIEPADRRHPLAAFGRRS